MGFRGSTKVLACGTDAKTLLNSTQGCMLDAKRKLFAQFRYDTVFRERKTEGGMWEEGEKESESLQ